jgi:hypothetical protein
MRRISLSLTRLEPRTVPATIRVTSLADAFPAPPGTLRAALAQADARSGKDAIVFQLPAPTANSENMITLTAGVLKSKGDITITGPGAGKLIISGNTISQVFNISDGDSTADHPASISGLSITGGHLNGLGLGGGVYSTESLSLTGVTLSGNSAGYGGAVFVNGGAGARSVKITRSLVSGNTASGHGGGLALYHLNSVQVTASIVTGNAAGAGYIGGGFYATLPSAGTGVTVSGCTITGNSAGFGAGAFLQNFSTVATAKTTVTGCTVTGNDSNGSGRGGGGLYLESGRISVSGCTISANVAAHQGAGMVASIFTSLSISRTAVTGNVTTQATDPGDGGGGLFVMGSINPSPLVPATISGCTFSTNVTPGDGGGALVTGGVRLTVTGSTFAGDVASGSGGGLCATGTGASQVAVTVAGCTFTGDRATSAGGGLAVTGDGPASVRSTRFVACGSGVGGGIYARSSAADGFVMTGCTLSGNFAVYGGGLGIENTPAFHVSGTSISNNWASGSGGGILVRDSGGSVLGTRVGGNAAANEGGGVYQLGTGTVVLQAAQVRGNTCINGPDVFGTFTFV